MAVTAFFRCYTHQYFLALQGLVLAPILILFDLLIISFELVKFNVAAVSISLLLALIVFAPHQVWVDQQHPGDSHKCNQKKDL